MDLVHYYDVIKTETKVQRIGWLDDAYYDVDYFMDILVEDRNVQGIDNVFAEAKDDVIEVVFRNTILTVHV